MLRVYLQLIFMVILWSFSFVIVDIAVEFIPPLSIALYRFVIASFSFLLIDLYFKLKKMRQLTTNNKIKTNFSKNDWLLLILASLTGTSLFFLFQYSSIEIIGPSLPALFICLLTPVIITILALIFFKEKVNLFKILGFAIATVGGFLLVTGGDIKNLAPDSPNFLGYLFALLTPILWAIYSTTTKKISKKNSTGTNTMNKYIAYIGTLELIIFVLINGEIFIFIQNFLNISLFLCAIYLGLGCYVVGYYIWQKSQKALKSLNVASFLYIEPFLTLLFSLLLQRSETIVLWNLIGGIIVLVAVLIINYKKKNKKKEQIRLFYF
ncbi:MAG: DMT family transporter [Candidatus Hodarchaeota archaeon]